MYALLLLSVVFCACQSSEKKEAGEPEKVEPKEIVDVVEYYPQGGVKLKGKSQGGDRLGRWISFYPNGLKWSEIEYRNGIKEGDAISYFPNGMMRYQGRYYNDERTGIWTFYDTTGALIQRVDMDMPQEEDLNLKLDSTGLN